MGILDLVKSKLSCFNLWEQEKYIYINQIYELYNGNNTCADQQPYIFGYYICIFYVPRSQNSFIQFYQVQNTYSRMHKSYLLGKKVIPLHK